jgi:hypothetical protein
MILTTMAGLLSLISVTATATAITIYVMMMAKLIAYLAATPSVATTMQWYTEKPISIWRMMMMMMMELEMMMLLLVLVLV